MSVGDLHLDAQPPAGPLTGAGVRQLDGDMGDARPAHLDRGVGAQQRKAGRGRRGRSPPSSRGSRRTPR